MDTCLSVRLRFEAQNADSCEKTSNCLLAPFRMGLGYRIWNGKTNTLTAKVSSICMAIFAYTIWLLPTLIGLALCKISKTHSYNCQAMQKAQALQQKMLPIVTTTRLSTSVLEPIKVVPHNVIPVVTTQLLVANITSATTVQNAPVTLAPVITTATSTVAQTPVNASTVTNVQKGLPEDAISSLDAVKSVYANIEKFTLAEMDALKTDNEINYAQTIADLSDCQDTYHRPLTAKLSRILLMEVMRIRGQRPQEDLILLLGAFAIKLSKVGFKDFEIISNKVFSANSTLQELRKSSSQIKSHPFFILGEKLKNDLKDMQHFDCFLKGYSDGELYEFALLFQYIGEAYAEIDEYRNDADLLEKYFHVAKGLFSYLDMGSRIRIGEMYAKTACYIHLLKHPGDVKGVLGVLDEGCCFFRRSGASQEEELRLFDILIASNQNSFWTRMVNLTLLELDIKLRVNHELIGHAVCFARSIPGYDNMYKWLYRQLYSALFCNKKNVSINMQEVDDCVKDLFAILKNDNYSKEKYTSALKDMAAYHLLRNNLGEAQTCFLLAEMSCYRFGGPNNLYYYDIQRFKQMYGTRLGI